MGKSDLNLHKSWHPGLLKNQAKRYDEEQKALAERKKTQARLDEIKEEREREQIQRQLAEASGRKYVDRVDWMYDGGPSNGSGTIEAEKEAFLLGKRKITSLLMKDEAAKNSQQNAIQDSFIASGNANSARDTAAKIREDPLLAIKKQEQSAYEALIANPAKRRQLLSSMGITDDAEKGQNSKGRDERQHHRRRHHRHRDNSDDDRRPRRRRSRSKSRSKSPRRRSYPGHRHRRSRRDGSEDDRDMRRGRDDSEGDRDRRRRREDSEGPGWKRRRNGSRNQSQDESDSESKSYRRRDIRERSQKRDYTRDSGHMRERREKSNHRSGHSRPSDYKPSIDPKTAEEERARKLAAMQEAAASLDDDREKRLAAIEEQERLAREADNRARERASRYGDDRRFVNSLHHKAADLGLAERVGRGRQGLQVDED